MAANPCPCGHLGIRGADIDSEAGGHVCLCSSEKINHYWRKLTGALLDRVEIRVGILPPKITEMGRQINDSEASFNEASALIAGRVLAAASIQLQRFNGTGIRRNALIPAGKIDALCPMSGKAESAFHKALTRLGLSGRAYHGILRVARTIADLEGRETIETEHILEAVQHRRFGDDPWDILSF
jgi:magnesium chelatase family protein